LNYINYYINKGISLCTGKHYIILGKSYIIHTFPKRILYILLIGSNFDNSDEMLLLFFPAIFILISGNFLAFSEGFFAGLFSAGGEL